MWWALSHAGPRLPRQWSCCLLCGWLQTHPFLQVLISHHEERCPSLVSPPFAVSEEGTGSFAGRGPASLAPLPSSFPAGSRPHPVVSRCPPLPHSQRVYKTRFWPYPRVVTQVGFLMIPSCLGELGRIGAYRGLAGGGVVVMQCEWVHLALCRPPYVSDVSPCLCVHVAELSM